MQCERCGGPIGNRITRINGVTICEKCADSLGINMSFGAGLGTDFPLLNGLTNAIMASGADLDFTKSKISCPRCGTKQREFELNNKVGCIECYNFFNDSILNNMLRLQGSTEYMGRKPGVNADIMPEIEIKEVEKTESTEKAENKTSEIKPTKKVPTDKKTLYEKLMKADLGMIDDKDIEEAMKQAAAAEDYAFAAKLRDELKSRKGGENNVE
ncbi:MAG: UvrB/UvrC motif-containing protein [Saccharofermentans sp.]|nr:UvrB/UvrC motif-containing protein [Saccharofermentans sp.]